jgi:hypothetical protein
MRQKSPHSQPLQLSQELPEHRVVKLSPQTNGNPVNNQMRAGHQCALPWLNSDKTKTATLAVQAGVTVWNP